MTGVQTCALPIYLRSYEEPYDLNGLIAQYDLDTVLLMFHQNNISAELTSFLLQ